MQLVQSWHASSLYSTRVLLARTTCATDDAAGAISARLKPLLDSCASGARYLCHRWSSWCNFRAPRAFSRSMYSWRTLPVLLMVQLVQSPNTSGLYLTRVLLMRGACAADTAACAVSERLGPLLNPGFPGAHYMCRRFCSFCSLCTPQAFTRSGPSWQARTVPLMLQLVQSPHAWSLYTA